MEQKLKTLRENLSQYSRVAVAFSGGVDSTFLLAVAHEVLGENVVACTATSQVFPAREENEAKAFCRSLGVRQVLFESGELDMAEFRSNPANRCYLCKTNLYKRMADAARSQGCPVILEGSNTDDLGDYRPGMQAVRECGVKSPLLDAGLSKADIRALSQQMGLPTWDKPSFACLASRFPFGGEITLERLHMVDAGEQYLIDLGFRQVRVRIHDSIARLEVAPAEMDSLYAAAKDPAFRQYFHKLGFSYVTLDLDGYRTGSMNSSA